MGMLLEQQFSEHNYVVRKELHENDYSKLWTSCNYKDIIGQIINFFSKHTINFLNSPAELVSIFKGKSERELDFIRYKIKLSDEKQLCKLYNIIVTVYNSERFEFLQLILNQNSSIDFFKKLDHYVQSVVYSGSRIVRLKYAIDELKSVANFLQAFDSIKYFEHILYLEDEILRKNLSIDFEKKREFMSEWGI